MKGIQWYIQLLPTKRNPNPDFKLIIFPLQNEKSVNLTETVKDDFGFILKAYLNEEKTCDTNEKILLFKQMYTENCMDIKVKLKSNIICDLIQQPRDAEDKNFVFNDKITSDFTIKLDEVIESKSKGNDKEFYVIQQFLLPDRLFSGII